MSVCLPTEVLAPFLCCYFLVRMLVSFVSLSFGSQVCICICECVLLEAIASLCVCVSLCVRLCGQSFINLEKHEIARVSRERCHEVNHAAVELLIFQGQPDWPMPILLREPQMVQQTK